jgi:tetratricopeptide (TPR) repeat protein
MGESMRCLYSLVLFTVPFCALSSGPAAADIADDCYRATLERPAPNDKIIALCSEAVRVTTGTRRAASLANRGVGYMQKGFLDAAMADFDESIALNPNDSWAYSNRANVWRLKGYHDRAIRELNDLIYRDPNFIGAYVDRGIVHQERGDFESARADFRTVLGMRGNRPDIEAWAREEARRRLDQLGDR